MIQENNVISRDVYCPYCKNEKAILINKGIKRKYSLRIPAYGLKFLLSFVYLSIVHVLRYGMKTIELVRENEILTYCFCPKCGKSYSLNPKTEISDQFEDPKLYRYENGAVLKGICKGISVLTEISLLWIRVITVLYAILLIIMEKKIMTPVTAQWFDAETRSSSWFKFAQSCLLYMLGIILVMVLYYFFAALLKSKNSESEKDG